jgi:hypothetical protein
VEEMIEADSSFASVIEDVKSGLFEAVFIHKLWTPIVDALWDCVEHMDRVEKSTERPLLFHRTVHCKKGRSYASNRGSPQYPHCTTTPASVLLDSIKRSLNERLWKKPNPYRSVKNALVLKNKAGKTMLEIDRILFRRTH